MQGEGILATTTPSSQNNTLVAPAQEKIDEFQWLERHVQLWMLIRSIATTMKCSQKIQAETRFL